MNELLELRIAALEVCKSFECYTAINKPKEEWDEYDYFMFPRWLKLLEILDVRKNLEEQNGKDNQDS